MINCIVCGHFAEPVPAHRDVIRVKGQLERENSPMVFSGDPLVAPRGSALDGNSI